MSSIAEIEKASKVFEGHCTCKDLIATEVSVLKPITPLKKKKKNKKLLTEQQQEHPKKKKTIFMLALL